MEREIKFRGKRLNNGEWVVGDLIHKNNGDLPYGHISMYGWRIPIVLPLPYTIMRANSDVKSTSI